MAAVVVFIWVLSATACRLHERHDRREEPGRRTVNRAKVALDGLLERASGELATAGRRGREVLPEERVVDVSCAKVDVGVGMGGREKNAHHRR